MNVMCVCVRVSQGLVPVRVGVRHLLQLSGTVLVLVMFVVLVFVGVLEGLVRVLVLMDVGAEQERAPGHPEEGQERGRMDGLMKEDPGEHGREARREREERARVHDAQLAETPDEEHDR